MGYGESNGYVTDILTWPRKAKIVTQLYLDANILKRQETKDRFQWTTTRNWPVLQLCRWWLVTIVVILTEMWLHKTHQLLLTSMHACTVTAANGWHNRNWEQSLVCITVNRNEKTWHSMCIVHCTNLPHVTSLYFWHTNVLTYIQVQETGTAIHVHWSMQNL